MWRDRIKEKHLGLGRSSNAGIIRYKISVFTKWDIFWTFSHGKFVINDQQLHLHLLNMDGFYAGMELCFSSGSAIRGSLCLVFQLGNRLSLIWIFSGGIYVLILFKLIQFLNLFSASVKKHYCKVSIEDRGIFLIVIIHRSIVFSLWMTTS